MSADQNKHQDSYYRDKLTTVSEDGKRVWVYPKKPKGRYYNWRRILASILLVFFYIMPFVKYKGDPLLLINIIERKFVIFGVIFWPQDFHLIVLSLISLVVFIILFTVIFGRIFCGWLCPQTIFMEFVFRQIEYLIEGDAHKQKKLARAPWNFNKLWRKSLKHLIFYTIAFITANTFLAYIISLDEVKAMYHTGFMENYSSFIGLFLFSGMFYFIFAFFREQVCTIACPYGRLQGVLLDNKSMVVAYDYVRGEPKGKHNPLEDRSKTEKGDCIDCKSCVSVCPTNIDIRNGTQLECINCTACMDACDAVMDRVKKPRGLIRYDSERGISHGDHRIISTRSLAYSIILTILLVVVGVLFAQRTDFETTILRQRGTLFQEYDSSSYSNIYQIEVVNKTRKKQKVHIEMLEPKGRVFMMSDSLVANKGEVGKATFLAVLKTDQLESANTRIIFGVYSENRLIQNYEVTFIAPRLFDK